MAYDDRETGLTVEDRGSKLGLPQNQDAEANVLAAMLLSPEVVEEAQVELQPDDFYRPIHKTIYTAMVDMYNSRIPIDSISLIDYLRSINKLDAVGGEAYILELMGQTLSLVNWQHHAAIVRRDSMLRELIGATNGFVKAPFVVEGIVIGILGAAFPLTLLYYLYTQLVGFVGDKFNALTGLLQFLPVNDMFRILLPVGLALGVGIGFFGSFFTIRKHLKV